MKPPRERPRQRSNRRRGPSRDDRNGLYMIGAAGAAIILVVILAMTLFREVKIDPRTGCPVDHKPPKAHTIILLDETDSLSRDDLAYAKSVIANEYYWLPVGGRLTVRNIVSDPDLAEDIVVCRMLADTEVLGAGRNPKKVKQDFERIAGARLDELYTALRTAKPQAQSPIMEYVSNAVDRANFGANVKLRRLVLVSDAAQHSDLFSQYGERARSQPSKAAMAELERDLSNVQVRVHYILRRKLKAVQGEAHRRFWKDYLQAMGATDVALGHGLLIGEKPDRRTWNDDE